MVAPKEKSYSNLLKKKKKKNKKCRKEVLVMNVHELKVNEENLFKHRYYLGLLTTRYFEIEEDLKKEDDDLRYCYGEIGSVLKLRKRLLKEYHVIEGYIQIHEITIKVIEKRIADLKNVKQYSLSGGNLLESGNKLC